MPAPASQLDLWNWTPPEPVARFAPERVRAAAVAARICQAVAAALRECEAPREVIAARMSDYLGVRISRNMLDGYASQGRPDQNISAARLLALLHATGDRRLMQALVDPFNWVVIGREHLPAIELAALREHQGEMARRARVLSMQLARQRRVAC